MLHNNIHALREIGKILSFTNFYINVKNTKINCTQKFQVLCYLLNPV